MAARSSCRDTQNLREYRVRGEATQQELLKLKFQLKNEQEFIECMQTSLHTFSTVDESPALLIEFV